MDALLSWVLDAEHGAEPLPPSPELIGLYVAHCAAPDDGSRALTAATIERRHFGLAWPIRQRGFTLDRRDRHVATVLAGVKRRHARPPVRKEAVLAEDIIAMTGTLPHDLRGLCDSAILLVGQLRAQHSLSRQGFHPL